jgi:type VI secretion system protein ImpA
MPLNSELVARLLEPIPGDSPSGQDLRYDPRVDAIKKHARRADLPGVTNRKLADWPTVVTACSDLLAKETKDLQLAVWLTEALLQKQGLRRTRHGPPGPERHAETFWDSVHPLPEG